MTESTEAYLQEFDPRNGTDQGERYLPNLDSLAFALANGEARLFTHDAIGRFAILAESIAASARAELRFRR